MQRLEVSCAVRLIYTSLGTKGLMKVWRSSEITLKHNALKGAWRRTGSVAPTLDNSECLYQRSDMSPLTALI